MGLGFGSQWPKNNIFKTQKSKKAENEIEKNDIFLPKIKKWLAHQNSNHMRSP